MATSRPRRPKQTRGERRLTLRDAADDLGVHYMTVYRYVRLGRLPATYDNGRWWVQRDHLDRLASPAPPGPGSRPSVYRDRLYRRLLAGDETGGWTVVETALTTGLSARRVLLEVVAPALRRIGDRWENGRVSVGEEHLATAVALRVVARLGPHLTRRGRPRGNVLLAGAPGDSHSLPLVLTADVLRGEGFAVTDLGADTPTASVVEAVGTSRRLLAVGVSLSAVRHVAAARRTIRAVRREADPGTMVFAGGPAVQSPEAAHDLGADAWAADAGRFADQLHELLR